jgi:hypothetical protein
VTGTAAGRNVSGHKIGDLIRTKACSSKRTPSARRLELGIDGTVMRTRVVQDRITGDPCRSPAVPAVHHRPRQMEAALGLKCGNLHETCQECVRIDSTSCPKLWPACAPRAGAPHVVGRIRRPRRLPRPHERFTSESAATPLSSQRTPLPRRLRERWHLTKPLPAYLLHNTTTSAGSSEQGVHLWLMLTLTTRWPRQRSEGSARRTCR